MRITAEMALHGVARNLRERIAPALDDPFAKEAARLAALLTGIMANSVDQAAAVRAEENARIRALFAEAAGLHLADRDLANRLAEASRSADPGLRISQLDTENGRLRGLLVQLHAAVEQMPGTQAKNLDQAIWRLLRDAETARA